MLALGLLLVLAPAAVRPADEGGGGAAPAAAAPAAAQELCAYPARADLAIDGDLSDWDRRGPLVLDGAHLRARSSGAPPAEGWAGPEDASGVFYLAFDRDHLYLAGEVRDDAYAVDDQVWWNGDSVELYLDVEREGDHRDADWRDDDYEFCFMPLHAGRPWGVARRGRTPLLSDGGMHGIEVAARPLAGAGYAFEARLPFADFPEFARGARRIGVDLALNDLDPRQDGALERSYLALAPPELLLEDPRRMVDCELVGQAPERAAIDRRGAPGGVAPWLVSVLVALLLIVLVAWISRPLFEWVDSRLRWWRRGGLAAMAFLAFAVGFAPFAVQRWMEWSLDRSFEDRAPALGRVVADVAEFLGRPEGRDLDDPERLLGLLRGQQVPARPAYDATCFEIRPPGDDANLRFSREGVPVRIYGMPLARKSTLEFPLPEPMELARLFVFGTARFDPGARSGGMGWAREQALEVGVRLADGQVKSEVFPALDRSQDSAAQPQNERVRVAWRDGDDAVEQYFLGAPTLSEALVTAILVTVRDPAVEFRLMGVTVGRAGAAAALEPLSLARPSLAGPPAALWDGYPRGIARVALPQSSAAPLRVPIGRELDALWVFYSTTDAQVLEPGLKGVEVGRFTLVAPDGAETAVPLRAGLDIGYGSYDPGQRPPGMASKVAFRWDGGSGATQTIELLEVPLPERSAVAEVRFANTGPLSGIALYAVTGGVRAAAGPPPTSVALGVDNGAFFVRPDVLDALRALGLAVFVDGRVAAVDLPDATLAASLKGARYPLGGAAAVADGEELQRAVLAGERHVVRYFPLGQRGGRSIVVAALQKLEGLALLKKVQRRMAYAAFALMVPLLLFYLLDGASRIARLRVRLTALLVATSLAPIALLFAVLYNVVAGDRASIREARARDATRVVLERLDLVLTQTRRTAREVLESEVVRAAERGEERRHERVESYLREVVALGPVPGLELALELELERAAGKRERFHDAADGERSSLFDVSDSGIHYHWGRLLFTWTEATAGAGASVRVTAVGEVLPALLKELSAATSSEVALMSLRGFPIAGGAAGAIEERARDVDEIREQNRPVIRAAADGAMLATALLRSPGGEPAALVEVALPPADLLLDVLLVRVPAERFFFWICVLGLAVAVFLGAVATWRITGPVEELELAARRIARGDLGVVVETRERGEVGRLARSFNKMTAELKRRATERSRLERALTQLTRSIDPSATAEAALAALAEDPPAVAAALYWREPDRDALVRLGRGRGDDTFPGELPFGEAWRSVIERREAYVASEPPPGARLPALPVDGLALILPLPLAERAVGLVVLYYGAGIDRDSIDASLPTLHQLAGQTAVALENARLYQVAIVEPATGLFVESYFMSRLAQEVDRAQHKGGRLAVVRIDLESWTRLEQRLGTAAAREAVARFARAWKAETRDLVLLARAGQTFYALLPECGRPEADDLVLRARRIAAEPAGSAALKAYGGVAVFPEDGRSSAFLLEQAGRGVLLARRDRAREALAVEGALGAAPELDLHPYVFRSPAMHAVLSQVARVASSSASVLLLGETGVGKEVVAELIHRWSDRALRPFVAINCSALPETLLEAELFGYEKGAFTGAVRAKPGQLEAADGGTLFLDEVGDMPLPIQAKLLRVLQDRTVQRLGGRGPSEVDVRVVAATHRDLPAMIEAGSFRSDLYFRLKVISLEIPPLRQRREDIPALVDSFAAQFAEENARPIQGFAPAALDRLHSYDWPGNVRELKNVVQRALLLAESDVVLPGSLAFEQRPDRKRVEASAAPPVIAAAVPAPPREHSGELNERQRQLLATFPRGATLRSKDYFDLVGVAPRTGLRDLSDLVDRGLLVRIGRRRAAAYRLPDGVPSAPATP